MPTLCAVFDILTAMRCLVVLIVMLLPVGAHAQNAAPAEEPPEVISRTEPSYTEEARKNGVEGSVAMRVEVDSKGRVRTARMIRLLGYGLDEAAIDSVMRWRFRPATRRGIPVSSFTSVEIHFRLPR